MIFRPWTRSDQGLAVACQPFLSARSLDNRFLAGTGGRLPGYYLRHIADGPRLTWDAHVAVAGGRLLGWAEYGRRMDALDVADLGALVVDPWQRQGIGSALIRALLPRAYAAGVRRLQADVLPSNQAAHAMLASIFGRGPNWQYAGSVIHYEFVVVPEMMTVGA